MHVSEDVVNGVVCSFRLVWLACRGILFSKWREEGKLGNGNGGFNKE